MVRTDMMADKKFAKYGYGWDDNWNNYDNFYNEYTKQKGDATNNSTMKFRGDDGKKAANATAPATPSAPAGPAAPATPAAPAGPAAPAKPAADAKPAELKKANNDLPPELRNPSKLHQKTATSSIEINGFKVDLNDLSSEDEDMDPELRSQDLTQMEETGVDEAIDS
jgi:hypothetical protein